MRVLAACCCCQEEEDAAPSTRFRLHLLDESTTYALAAVRLVHDECADPRRRPFVLDRRRRVQVSKADDFVVQLRDDDAVTDDDETLEPRRDCRSVRLVAQLAEQGCNRNPVARQSIPNRQTHAQ